jgi:hypothetical protein
MGKADKKQRHEAKRKAKRNALRRRDAQAPVQRLAAAPGEAECWMSEGFEENRQVEFFCFKRGAGTGALACFLVDRGVVGLKDAYVRTGVDREELEFVLRQSRDHGIRMRRTDVAEVRRWVAGALRWAHENGMRLPKDWVKTASLIGGVGDWKTADVSAFAKEFAGHPDDLRRRLIAEPFESYVRRTDVDFVFSDAAPVMDQRTGEYLNTPDEFADEDEFRSVLDALPDEEVEAMLDRLTPPAAGLTAKTIAFLRSRGELPSTELLEAWRSTLLATLLANAAMPGQPRGQVVTFARELLDGLGDRIGDPSFPEYERGLSQASEYLAANVGLVKDVIAEFGGAGEGEGETES